MLALLIIPILICGYLLISILPNERLLISLHQGWSLYLRAALYGSAIVLGGFIHFSILLPSIWINIGHITGVSIFPNTNLLIVISEYIKDYSGMVIEDSDKATTTLHTLSLSFISFFQTIIVSFFIGESHTIVKTSIRFLKTIEKCNFGAMKDSSDRVKEQFYSAWKNRKKSLPRKINILNLLSKTHKIFISKLESISEDLKQNHYQLILAIFKEKPPSNINYLVFY